VVLASTAIFGSESHGTHGHTSLPYDPAIHNSNSHHTGSREKCIKSGNEADSKIIT
jgi:hypothetical protein